MNEPTPIACRANAEMRHHRRLLPVPRVLCFDFGVGMGEHCGPGEQFVYRFASSVFGWPIDRLAFWLAAAGLFFASYAPTMISRHFRCLFGAIPLVGILVLVLMFGIRKPVSAEAGSRAVAA